MFTATRLNRRNQRIQKLSRLVLGSMTGLLILPVIIILSVLVYKGGPIISFEFLFTSPTHGMTAGGIFPALLGTILLVLVALLASVPLGIAAAIYLSEYAHIRVKSIVKPVLEILAGVPTVVYGYFALTFVTPVIRAVFPGTSVFNGASASIVMGIMIIPMVSSLSEDAMSAVPRSLREAAYALGATRVEVATRTVVPAALSGIIASFILAISRALGETMIVTIAAGATPALTLNPFQSVQTMTAYIAQTAAGEAPHGSVEYRTIFAVGLTLFAITLLMNIISGIVLRRYREVYE